MAFPESSAKSGTPPPGGPDEQRSRIYRARVAPVVDRGGTEVTAQAAPQRPRDDASTLGAERGVASLGEDYLGVDTTRGAAPPLRVTPPEGATGAGGRQRFPLY
jgi:hypothetical protein